ncbi:MAG: NADH:ubiquinone reductase (Na(+)-transporting) subunit F, partial [Planctomycetota bacterium]
MEMVLGVSFFTAIILALVVLILIAKKRLVPSGDVKVIINDDESKPLVVPAGGKLLNVLGD